MLKNHYWQLFDVNFSEISSVQLQLEIFWAWCKRCRILWISCLLSQTLLSVIKAMMRICWITVLRGSHCSTCTVKLVKPWNWSLDNLAFWFVYLWIIWEVSSRNTFAAGIIRLPPNLSLFTERKEKIVANLANFAYDPYNYTFLRQVWNLCLNNGLIWLQRWNKSLL